MDAWEKVEAVAVLGAVLRPASKWDRLVRGVGAPLSLVSVDALMASNERGLIFWPPRREARPEPGMPIPFEVKLLEVILSGRPPVSIAQKRVLSIERKKKKGLRRDNKSMLRCEEMSEENRRK